MTVELLLLRVLLVDREHASTLLDISAHVVCHSLTAATREATKLHVPEVRIDFVLMPHKQNFCLRP